MIPSTIKKRFMALIGYVNFPSDLGYILFCEALPAPLSFKLFSPSSSLRIFIDRKGGFSYGVKKFRYVKNSYIPSVDNKSTICSDLIECATIQHNVGDYFGLFKPQLQNKIMYSTLSDIAQFVRFTHINYESLDTKVRLYSQAINEGTVDKISVKKINDHVHSIMTLGIKTRQKIKELKKQYPESNPKCDEERYILQQIESAMVEDERQMILQCGELPGFEITKLCKLLNVDPTTFHNQPEWTALIDLEIDAINPRGVIKVSELIHVYRKNTGNPYITQKELAKSLGGSEIYVYPKKELIKKINKISDKKTKQS